MDLPGHGEGEVVGRGDAALGRGLAVVEAMVAQGVAAHKKTRMVSSLESLVVFWERDCCTFVGTFK